MFECSGQKCVLNEKLFEWIVLSGALHFLFLRRYLRFFPFLLLLVPADNCLSMANVCKFKMLQLHPQPHLQRDHRINKCVGRRHSASLSPTRIYILTMNKKTINLFDSHQFFTSRQQNEALSLTRKCSQSFPTNFDETLARKHVCQNVSCKNGICGIILSIGNHGILPFDPKKCFVKLHNFCICRTIWKNTLLKQNDKVLLPFHTTF